MGSRVSGFDLEYQISPLWNKLCAEYLGNRADLPAIKKFACKLQPSYWTLEMQIASRYREYFGAQGWPKVCPRENDAEEASKEY